MVIPSCVVLLLEDLSQKKAKCTWGLGSIMIRHDFDKNACNYLILRICQLMSHLIHAIAFICHSCMFYVNLVLRALTTVSLSGLSQVAMLAGKITGGCLALCFRRGCGFSCRLFKTALRIPCR